MPRIIIDPGHGGNDAGDIYENRLEKDDDLKLALAVGDILKNKYNYNVVYTRTTDIYKSQLGRARIANEADGDLLLSIHRIIGDIPVNPPGLGFYIDEEEGLSEVVANNIRRELEEVGFLNYLIDVRTDLPLFRETNMPSIMLGIGYLNSEIDNELFDTKLEEIAEEIAEGVVQSFSETPETASEINSSQVKPSLKIKSAKIKSTPPPIYRIRVGIHSIYQNAFEQQKALIIKGYPAEITRFKESYSVEVGEYQELDTAVYVEGLLQREGYITMIFT